MSSLPHDLMDEPSVGEVDDLERSDTRVMRSRQKKPVLALLLVLTIIVCCVISALISWMVVDFKSARQSPLEVRVSALENGLAINGGAIEGQKLAIADLRGSISSLDNSMATFRNSGATVVTDQLKRDVQALRLNLDDLKLKVEALKTARKSVVVNNAVNKAPVKAHVQQIINTQARVYSIRTQGDKQWATLTENGRISPALAVGDSWSNVKIKLIEDSKVIVEVNKKEIPLFI